MPINRMQIVLKTILDIVEYCKTASSEGFAQAAAPINAVNALWKLVFFIFYFFIVTGFLVLSITRGRTERLDGKL